MTDKHPIRDALCALRDHTSEELDRAKRDETAYTKQLKSFKPHLAVLGFSAVLYFGGPYLCSDAPNAEPTPDDMRAFAMVLAVGTGAMMGQKNSDIYNNKQLSDARARIAKHTASVGQYRTLIDHIDAITDGSEQAKR